ncbi:MAG: hypothetical protein WCG51_01610, partial [Elusimicrobiota bacterium]
SAEVHILEQKYQSKETEIVEIRSAITNIVVRENATKEDLFSCAAQRTTLHNDQNRLISLQSHCQAQIAALKKDLERLLQNEDPINADIAVKQSEIDIAVASLEGTRATLTRIREQMGISEANITTSVDLQRTLNEKMIALESRANMIREWEQKDPVRGTMRVTMSAAIAGIRGPVSGWIDIDPGMEEIVGAALGDMLNYIVADTMDAAQKAIQLLKETNGGRLTFVVLECLPEHSHSKPIALPAAARSLLAIIQCAPAYERLVKFLCQNTMINGTEIYANAVVQGGSKISFDKPVLIEGQLHQLTQDTEKIRHELTLAAGSMNERNATLAALRDEYRAAEMECQKIELHNGWMEKQLADKREERELILTGISLNKRDISEKEIEEQQVIEQQNIIANKLTELLSREQSLNEDLLRHETDQHKQRTQEESVAPLLTEAKVVWATQSSELSSRQREEQKLSEMTADTRRQIEQYRQELSSIDAKTVELAAVRSAESTHLIELRVAQTTKERQVQSTYNERQGFLKILDEKTGIIVEMRQQVEALKQEIHNRQMDLRSFELKLQSSQQRLSEEYSAVYEELKTEFLALAVNEEEVTRLKRKIDAMGAVNLAAPEEYTALEERYNFLLTQQQDLLKAKEDMLEVIAKINHTTRDHFKQTFDKVRENFRILYHQLFEGGEADLVLTDESNLLETGVEIMAQPPGKKLQNITLLSGGEKALTAIALLFAFFMVRPSPFCILDEVDAPLDDANIGRYINMIKSFAERSQFLVVTHNKRTMEMADVLYGVTMEELGVSKIISIKLKKISELAAV